MKKTSVLLIAIAFLLFQGCGTKKSEKNQDNMKMTDQLKVFSLTNKHGAEVKITNFGGKVMSLQVPDKNGNLGDVVLGYEQPEDYINGEPYFGALIGRYGNRIDKGRFTLDGETYQLPQNNGPNHLHGGPDGFHNVIWEAKLKDDKNPQSLHLTYVSKDGEMGYPGRFTATVVYTWTDNYELKIDYHATSDKKTIVNLTHHSFFNLKDAGKSKILDHELTIHADQFTPIDSGLIPTGEIREVKGTPMDFTQAKKMGAEINAGYQQLEYGNGYDHNWVLNKPQQDAMTLAAEVYEPTTGRKMEVHTTEPGLQFYSGNFLDGSQVGKNGVAYEYRTAFCLEAQHFPDSPNHENFPSTVLKPGETYKKQTIYKFSTIQ
ncbi:MAG: galactose mutarotase [Bacteroidales bacterium]|nr:galactose mutarotase [Bacteroidales bacterium]